MPPGKKRRKAARKKKEQEANTINPSTTNIPHGNDDPKSRDERDSDGGDGDGSSYTSQDDHNHQQPSNLVGEEEGSRALSPDQLHVTKGKSVEEAARVAESIENFGLTDVVDVHIVEELEPKGDIVSTDVHIHHLEQDKSSNSSSRSSSDDESHAFVKKSKEEASNFPSEAMSHSNEDKSATVNFDDVKIAENEAPVNVVSYSIAAKAAVKSEDDGNFAEKETTVDVVCHSAVETFAVETPVKTVLPVTEEVDQSTEISINKSVVSDAIESGYRESEENLLPSPNGVSGITLEEITVFPVSEEVDQASEITINKSVVSGDTESGYKEREENLLASSNGVSGVKLEEKIVLPVSEEVDKATDITINKSLVSDSIESGNKESEENSLPTSNGVPRDTIKENEGKFFPSSDTVNAESSNVVEKAQDHETLDYSEKQPLVASTPPMVQRTSVFNCCGIFDVFAGSRR